MFQVPERERLFYYGVKTINVESTPILPEEFDDLAALRGYMIPIMLRHNGLGLSAPEVGIFRNFFIMKTDEGDIIDIVNPEIVQMYGHEKKGFEACLSLPPVGNGSYEVQRLEHVRLEYGTSQEPGTRSIRLFSGMDAIVVQHEMDHLTGTFFIDRVKEKQRKIVLKTFEKWRQENYATHRP